VGAAVISTQTLVRPPPFQVSPIFSQQDVETALKEEMKKWGIDIRKQDHKKFADLAMKETIDCFNGRIDTWKPPDTTIDVPLDLSDAIEVLLRIYLQRRTDNGSGLTFQKTRDLIQEDFEERIPYPPFLVGRAGSGRLNGSYRNLPLQPCHLDPLQRFSFYDMDAESSLREEWETSKNHFTEATAIHQIVHGGHPCLKCGESSFRLNSNLNVSFSDVICMTCQSIYTVWNAKNDDAIFKKITKGQVEKSRFYVDFLEEKKHLSFNASMFVACVSSETMINMPVYVAKLDYVRPILNDRSFRNMEKIRIMSKVIVTRTTLGLEPWFRCTLPISSMKMQALSMNAIDEYFGALRGFPSHSDQADTQCNVDEDLNKLRPKIRQLRKKRNKIESLKKRLASGESLDPEENLIVDEEEAVLVELEACERLLKDA
jgi:hypothetical protein